MEKGEERLKKIISILFLLIIAFCVIPACRAAYSPGNVNIYLWADKTQYKPGDTITLYYTIFNDKSSGITINEINITTPWFMKINNQWQGNQTITINKAIPSSGSYNNHTTLTVPNDGRASFTSPYVSLSVTLRIDDTPIPRTVNVNIANPPIQTSVHEVDTIILLLAVLIILFVVCTAFIAAAIFLSARKPQETYPQTSSQS
jgi:hypothetical protein